MDYNLIACGGTFDYFHKGHEQLLRTAFQKGKQVIIGITSDEYVKKTKKESREPYITRKSHVWHFLKKNNLLKQARLMQINDIYGPTADKDFPIEAIVVSEATRKHANKINEQRRKRLLSPLDIITVPMVITNNKKIVSSSAIRAGVMDITGSMYIPPQWFHYNLQLPEHMRQQLQQPFGEVITEIDKWLKKQRIIDIPGRITVGDIVTKTCNAASIGIDLAIIDFKTERVQRFASLSELGFTERHSDNTAYNPPGYITADMLQKLQEFFHKKEKKSICHVIQVVGEEDLTVLPCILFAPLGWQIYYGQPSQGIVCIDVTADKKQQAKRLLDGFSFVTL